MEGDKDHLQWIYDRMAFVLFVDQRLDYMIRFKAIIDAMEEDT